MDDTSVPVEGDMVSTEDGEGLESGGGAPPVKSAAVVKYSAVTAPAMFATLQSNTDIKTPPSNWMSSSGDRYGLNHPLSSHSSAFSSFRMAHMFPDCVGEVDVVSDAENIKKLLKIPYSTSPVSMMVHRIENTLLIDEFDIHKHLLTRAESDWTWLQKFFREQILQTLKNKCLSYKNNSRNALQEKSLVSKFLHYSIAETAENLQTSQNFYRPLPLTMKGPTLPEPRLEEGLPDSSSDHKFTRNVVWTFEDIQMLLGTDIPIFGGSTRPCISLRLRDATKPISVLTGIDYWLDNLMSNVPEVVMCYHLDGIVQKYELIKTEDLPQLPESKFSPKVIRDVAQNILSFLKANATKAGHTYWLFKGKNEDAVKLYDLTSLCSDSLEEKDQNPFIVPVGMLLYTVARNMRAYGENSVSQLATIRMLLKNCLSLLDREKYPEIVSSTHYMLSDVYIPCETDPCCPQLEDIPSHPEPGEEEDDPKLSNSVNVMSLCLSGTENIFPDYKHHAPPPIVGSLEDRCHSSLQHVREGLDCLQFFKLNKDVKEEKRSKQEPKMANPREAIPMPYSRLDSEDRAKKKRKETSQENSSEEDEDRSLKALLCRPNSETLPKWQKPEKVDNASWKRHLSSLLTTKACLVYSILAQKDMQAERYRWALERIRGVLRCSSENAPLAGLMLAKAGQCLYYLCRKPPRDEPLPPDYPEVSKSPPVPYEKELALIPTEFDNSLSIISSCISCYKRSLDLCPTPETSKHLGNAYNDLGNAYNDMAAEMLQNDQHMSENVKFASCIMEAESLLSEGLKIFKSINDRVNTALVTCNVGRLWRLKAHTGLEFDSPFTSQQKNMYTKAVESYNEGLGVIGSRKANPPVWDSIMWELSTTLYTLATRYQDRPLAQCQEEAEREAVELLQKALKACDLQSETARLPLYQFRAAILHHRIAALYHSSIRKKKYEEIKRKTIRQLCQLHYEKAYNLYCVLENPLEILRIQLERLSLAEFFLGEMKGAHRQMKCLQEALSHITACKWSLVTLDQTSKSSEIDKEEDRGDDECRTESEAEREQIEELVSLVEERLSHTLRALIRIHTTTASASTSKSTVIAAEYKEIYRQLLKKDSEISLVLHLVQVIDKLTQLKNTK